MLISIPINAIYQPSSQTVDISYIQTHISFYANMEGRSQEYTAVFFPTRIMQGIHEYIMNLGTYIFL